MQTKHLYNQIVIEIIAPAGDFSGRDLPQTHRSTPRDRTAAAMRPGDSQGPDGGRAEPAATMPQSGYAVAELD